MQDFIPPVTYYYFPQWTRISHYHTAHALVPEDQNDKVIRQHQSCVRFHIPRGISEGECRAPSSSEINFAIVSKKFYSAIL